MEVLRLADPAAVRQAIAQFDALGRTEFLRRYGFPRARAWMLRDARGNLYDAAALAAAAHGIEHPDLGPLAPAHLADGEAGAAECLRRLGFEPVEIGRSWSAEEVAATVEAYFRMLDLESRGERYNKAAYNAELRARLATRSRGAVELKHQNVSAVLLELGLPYVPGYKPLGNVQTLLREAVRQYVGRHAEALGSIVDRLSEALAPAQRTYAGVLVEPPTVGVPSPQPEEPRARIPRRIDFAARDDRNRALGELGEAWAVGYEKARLHGIGLETLAERIDWVAQRLGDGLGYDVQSFDPPATVRYIEVKTTNGPAPTPFFVTQNEIDFSREQDGAFWLYRVFDFRAQPRLFALQGELDRHFVLIPTDYRARLRALG